MAALDAAEAAFEGWAARKPRERGEILRKCYELIMRDAERFAKLITLENGKALPNSRGEVAYAAEFFRWYAEEAVRNLGTVSMAPASGARIVAQHQPAGIAVLVTPWNFPAAMATRKIGPALAAGCPVILKPASDTPLTMLALMPALEEAGVPAGVVNVIPSRSSGKVVSAMLHDPRVRVVSFTGSTEVGRKLLHEAADNILKPAMELGGNAPFIVFEDADIDAAIDGAMVAKMRNMGEACTAANRFYRAREGARRVCQEADRQNGRPQDGQRPRRRRQSRAAGQQGWPRQGNRAGRRRGEERRQGADRRQAAGRSRLLLSGDRAVQRVGRRQDAERGNLRTRRFAADLQDRRTR